MAIQKINDDFYIDTDSIRGMRWWNGVGIVFLGGNKVGIQDREAFDKLLETYRWGKPVYDGKKRIKGAD